MITLPTNQISAIPSLMSNQRAWLLLNLNSDGSTLKQLYKNTNTPKTLLWLYQGTLLNDYKKQGPCLVDCSSELLADFSKQPDKWPGFLVYSQQDAEAIVSHFRTMITVRFYEQEKGILNYLDKRVAHFFFQMPQHQLNIWLGPIDALYWYGGDFIQTAKGQQQLQGVTQQLPLAERSTLPAEPLLTFEQTELLEACQQQQSIWEWSVNVNTPFTDAWQSYQEANSLTFTGNEIEQYMQLRRQYPHQPLPNKWPEHITGQQKLQQITTLWNTAG